MTTPNLDSLSVAELRAFADSTKITKLRLYALMKIAARQNREAGHVVYAQHYEIECDKLYATLRKRDRW